MCMDDYDHNIKQISVGSIIIVYKREGGFFRRIIDSQNVAQVAFSIDNK